MKKVYFKGIKTLEELKELYYKLVKENHPDLHPEKAEIMKAINAEYDEVFKKVKNIHLNHKTNETYEYNYNENVRTFKDIINKYINIKDLTILVTGAFIWISGDCTKDYKITNEEHEDTRKAKEEHNERAKALREQLKADKFHWCNEKQKWSFSTRPYKSLKNKSWGFDRITNTYGVTEVTNEVKEMEKLNA